jgi:hypothetical protein
MALWNVGGSLLMSMFVCCEAGDEPTKKRGIDSPHTREPRAPLKDTKARSPFRCHCGLRSERVRCIRCSDKTAESEGELYKDWPGVFKIAMVVDDSVK